jgi:hypothetical protein
MCSRELVFDVLVKWRNVGSQVVGVSRDGGRRKVPKVLYHDTPVKDLLIYMKPKPRNFFIQNFNTHWQDEQFKTLFVACLVGSIISCIYFSKTIT